MRGRSRAAPRPESEPLDRYDRPAFDCDLVMKGGVTSGVIYPLAICRLAERYRLRSIGGASAGAIAAAAAAAAEYARQNQTRGDGVGFSGLERLPAEIQQPVGDAGQSRLLSLFQPAPANRTVFEAFLLAISQEPVRRRIARILRLVVSRHPFFPRLAIAVSVLAIAATALTGSVLATVAVVATAACAVAVGVALAAVAAVRAGLAGLAANGAGLCSGSAPRGEADTEPGRGGESSPGPGAGGDSAPALCEWLTDLFDRLAGKRPGDPPLTFGELASKNIELAMITTNLTHGRPYRLPFEASTFFFRVSELSRLFPARVVTCMTEAASRRIEAIRLADRRADSSVDDARILATHRHHERQSPGEYFPFPEAADLPVVVATRLSLSFPILLSAVPLHAVDWTRKHPEGTPVLERCWFSDGGICSNLPIHFFDALLPRRPTFALNLEEPHPDYPVEVPPFTDGKSEADNVWMPTPDHDGSAENWTRIGSGSGLAPAQLLGAMVDAMMSWSDNMQSKAPGYRERIIHIPHLPDEGGLHLTMPPDVIARLSNRGAAAGELAVDRFAPPPGSGRPDGFAEHLWIRYRSAMAMLQDLLGRSYAFYFVDDEPRKTLERLIMSNKGDLTDAQLDLVNRVNQEFARLGAELKQGGISLATIAPTPQPELRARPRGA
ncbi:MAG TPA: hypothetical protein VKB80_27075 [Kofleriaceae bacterium]|nr:hypothetical protein [Kofleriaceae bacterium]